MTGRLDQKVIGITGGGSGMGLAFAEAFAREGACILVVDLNEDAATAAVQRIQDGGGRAVYAVANVVNRDEVSAAIQTAVETFGRLDAWFNNAGYNKAMQFLDVTEDNFRAVMDVNALGVLIGTQEAAKQMITQGSGGKIINTSSMAGREGFPTFAPYCASKASVISLTQSAAKALAQHDITVTAFAPGVVVTPLWDKLDEDLYKIGDIDRPGTALGEYEKGIIRGRNAYPADIVGTALFLASSDSDYMTAQCIMIDGGATLV
ncbi:shikimate dehydrogenase [Microbacterium sp. B35-04]|uniref:SDR family NAD(P)-dependent oxidoreductase n=1 Tax=unclassified Microbacterium TaxID=2609290 RepID=UPI0013D8C2C4|nr:MULTISPECIES: SDR family NAD(P)-dependent oxidoreductase [unclassified Microbacterium]KAF2414681.1 shikimate dehydrogenase [Microbacterium sp. B35-04]KAF2417613.1 shikimate dehydrogenase [Microbacterium sp. B35-30]